jgi:hypothetical protein
VVTRRPHALPTTHRAAPAEELPIDVVLAVTTSSPYRNSVAKFADEFAASIGGEVRALSPAQAHASIGIFGPGTVEDAQEQRLNRAESDAEQEVGAFDTDMLVCGEWLLGPPVQECAREMARSDFGVVGRTLAGELPGGRSLGNQVIQLERSRTKPLVIVPREVRPLRNVVFVYTNHPEAGMPCRWPDD